MIDLKNLTTKDKNNPLINNITDGGFLSIFRKIGVIGDSLASGEHEYLLENGEKGYYDMYEYSWGQFMARKCGNTVLNFSKGGLKATTFLNYAKENCVFKEENKCQAYIIALGVNDLNHIEDTYPDGFGSFCDVDINNSANNKNSFVGQYSKIIQKIQKLEKDAKIFVMTIPEGQNTSTNYEKLKVLHAEFLRSLPYHFKNVYVLDFNKYLLPFDEEFKNRFFIGGHMNAMGYKLVADLVINYIDNIICENYEDFKKIAFIGKEVDCNIE